MIIRLVLCVFACLQATAALATCITVARSPLTQYAALGPLAAVEQGKVRITFVGHASFEIESPEGVRAVTDYNGFVRPARMPHIVTMNNSHRTHFTELVESEILHALRGWSEDGIVRHNVVEKDMRVRNVPTNLREWGNRLSHGNSIFVFEAVGLCVAHISHVHHALSEDQIRELGSIDVALVAVDGTVTMSHEELFEALDKLKPRLIIPMHMVSGSAVAHFVALAEVHYPVKRHDSDTIVVSTATLPQKPEVLFLQGY
jgi:L-ascorbate metabolism protein UlaG (beta-lactamase superfamily)